MNKTQILGLTVGLIMGCVLVGIMAFVKKSTKTRDDYDERQAKMRGIASRAAFLTMIALETILFIITLFTESFLMVPSMWHLTVLLVCCEVYGNVTLWTDSYYSNSGKKKAQDISVYTSLAGIGILMGTGVARCISAHNLLTETGLLSDNAIPLFVLIFIVIFMISLTVKNIYEGNHKQDEE